MAAAYAALMSLMHTSKLILHPSQHWLHLDRNQIESLLQKVCFLQEFLEDYSHRPHEEMAELESQIAAAAYAAEDIVESHVSDQILARSTGSEAKSSTSFSEYIHKVIEDMEDLIETKVMRIKGTIGGFEEVSRFVDVPAVSSRLAPNDLSSVVVGFDDKVIEIMDTLTGQQSNRQIVAIVGMGGIGKTTLAKNVYDNPHIKHYFHIRAWATISQNYSTRKIILEMLSEIHQGKPESVSSDDQFSQRSYESKQSGLSDEELREHLHKSLSGMRYLIVMDDLWGIDVWHEIRALFPNNFNGSRILITTRMLNVVKELSPCRPFEIELLNDDQSWELLQSKVFGKQGCPSELEELGKNIATKCGGLPLAIVVISGLLAKSDKTREFWKFVEENLNSITNSVDDESCLKILYLSYKHLPVHLKPCFLYMAVGEEDQYSYNISYLTRIFIAEGFLKPIRAKSLEEVAYEYITDLIDRNLIFVSRQGTLGRSRACSMHDLLRDLCIGQAEKESFLTIVNKQYPCIAPEVNSRRRLFLYQAPKPFGKPGKKILDLLRPASLTRSLVGEFGWALWLAPRLRLLRVLDAQDEEPPPTGKEIMQLVNLRFIRIVGTWYSKSMWRFTSSISQFWSLQFLYFHDYSDNPIFLPSEIWDLPQLRLLIFNRVILPDPACSDNDEHDSRTLEHLQTLSTVVNFRCTKEFLKRVPNLKKLRVTYNHLSPGLYWPYFGLHNLVHLNKVESLKFNTLDPIYMKYLSFPLSLKELKLSGCCSPWKDMTILGSLPNLEVLEIRSYAFKGLEWCPVEGDFVRLKLLVIEKTDLLHWRGDKTHFPILEHLVLQDLELAEIPRDLGELQTLRKLELFYCSDSTNTWADQIREEQESFGNEDLQIIIKRKGEDDD